MLMLVVALYVSAEECAFPLADPLLKAGAAPEMPRVVMGAHVQHTTYIIT
jgi:hypothetical protein